MKRKIIIQKKQSLKDYGLLDFMGFGEIRELYIPDPKHNTILFNFALFITGMSAGAFLFIASVFTFTR